MRISKSLLLVVPLLLSYPAQLDAANKDQRAAFLATEGPGLISRCKDKVMDTAKNPQSIQYLGGDSYEYARFPLRNNILVHVPMMGMNSYGAVLRHYVTCSFSCKIGEGCSLADVSSEE
jgi:hypothetical protein